MIRVEQCFANMSPPTTEHFAHLAHHSHFIQVSSLFYWADELIFRCIRWGRHEKCAVAAQYRFDTHNTRLKKKKKKKKVKSFDTRLNTQIWLLQRVCYKSTLQSALSVLIRESRALRANSQRAREKLQWTLRASKIQCFVYYKFCLITCSVYEVRGALANWIISALALWKTITISQRIWISEQ